MRRGVFWYDGFGKNRGRGSRAEMRSHRSFATAEAAFAQDDNQKQMRVIAKI
jgi:hypothetical protein